MCFSAVRLAYDDKVILNTPPDSELVQSSGRRPVQPPDPGRLCARLGGLERPRTDDAALRDRAADRLRLRRPVQAGRAERGRPAGVPADRRTRCTSTVCARRSSPTTLAALDRAVSPQDWNALFLSSPEFMR